MPGPTICGTIERRLLVNFRVDPSVLAGSLPPPFRPQLVGEFGLAGICLIRLRRLRPRGWPAWSGISSENAAHRIAVEWKTPEGIRSGVFVPRRDSDSRINTVIGGRIFPGVHPRSKFDIRESDDWYSIDVTHPDGTSIAVTTRRADQIPADSVFESLAEASEFFARGSMGFSVSRRPGRFEGLELRSRNWKIEPLAVDHVVSSVFGDRRQFPGGTIEFDSAFLMRDVPHEWHALSLLCANGAGAMATSATAAAACGDGR